MITFLRTKSENEELLYDEYGEPAGVKVGSFTVPFCEIRDDADHVSHIIHAHYEWEGEVDKDKDIVVHLVEHKDDTKGLLLYTN